MMTIRMMMMMIALLEIIVVVCATTIRACPLQEGAAAADVVIVGSGVGSYGFISSWMKLRPEDEILVIEAGGLPPAPEDWPNYNYGYSAKSNPKFVNASSPYPWLFGNRFEYVGGGISGNGLMNTVLEGSESIASLVAEAAIASTPLDTPNVAKWFRAYENAGYTVQQEPYIYLSQNESIVGPYSFAWYVPRENRYNLVLEDLFGITQETLLEGSVVADFHESRMLNGTSQSLRLVRARAKRVVFENDGSGRPMAVGVADEDGCFYEARSKVVLSGGVFGTFEVLLASGIGPDAMLQQLGVDPVAVNEDVGKFVGDESELTIGYYAPNEAEVRPDYIQTILGTFNGSHIAHGANMAWAFLKGAAIYAGVPQSVIVLAQRSLASLVNEMSVVFFGFKTDRPMFSLFLDEYDEVSIDTSAVEFTETMCNDVRQYVDDVVRPALAEIVTPSALGSGGLSSLVESLLQSQQYPSVLENSPTVYIYPDLNISCVPKDLASYQHWHGGCGAAVVDEKFAVKGVGGLYVADGSIVTEINPGHPWLDIAHAGSVVAMRAAAVDTLSE